MKKLLTVLAIAAIGSASLFSCKKSDSTSTTYSMKATINGVAFNGSSCYGSTSSGALGLSGGTGTSSASMTFPFITFTISSYTGVGTYTLGTTGTTVNVATLDSTAVTAPVALYGSLVVTGTNPLTGTFSFTCADSTKVTGGTFTAKTN